MHSKKINHLIACIKKLDLTNREKADIQSLIKKWSHDITRDNEDKILSIIIFFEILAKYPELMNKPKHKAFIRFGATEVNEMPELTHRHKLPKGR